MLYRAQTATAAAELPSDARAEAGDTLGGAAAVADSLPPAEGTLVLDTARTAFTDTLQTVSIVATVVAFALPPVVVAVLHQVGKPGPAARRSVEARAGSRPAATPRDDHTLKRNSTTSPSCMM
ncbi:hypothetical protein GCM10027563_16230 [Parasphingorhabdus pacifica]